EIGGRDEKDGPRVTERAERATGDIRIATSDVNGSSLLCPPAFAQHLENDLATGVVGDLGGTCHCVNARVGILLRPEHVTVVLEMQVERELPQLPQRVLHLIGVLARIENGKEDLLLGSSGSRRVRNRVEQDG